ncbi:unnamed protein product [Brachionus calyciflorus]|uniref:Uncharacterized protein n=1 Tax=Brachionus calyciflorus TaxID=104777 RepID=A0A814DA05_9BILA|nr:unnamed protein product [Brachionus calyciflorus]
MFLEKNKRTIRSKSNISESSTSTANDDLTALRDNDMNQVQQYQKKSYQRNSNQLPAIKLRISDAVLDKFNNPYNVVREIQRCKGVLDFELKIKFATFNKNKVLVIVTDEEDTHKALSSPNDAFLRGIRMKNQSEKSSMENQYSSNKFK